MAFAGLTSTLDSAFTAVGSLWAIDSRSYSMGATREVSVSSARTGMLIFATAGGIELDFEAHDHGEW
jgi:hypothetical protein